MSWFIYELDEFQPWPGLSVYVYGQATIAYSWEGRDRDTGEWPGPCDIEVEEIKIHGSTNEDDWAVLWPDHPLYKPILDALLTSDHVVAACIEDHDQ